MHRDHRESTDLQVVLVERRSPLGLGGDLLGWGNQIKSCHAAADHESGLLVREWGDGDPRCASNTAVGVQRQGDHRRRASADQ